LTVIVSRWLSSILIGHNGVGPAHIVAMAAIIALVATLATAWPTLKAMRVQPAAALRVD
jgi:hypothetical protein